MNDNLNIYIAAYVKPSKMIMEDNGEKLHDWVDEHENFFFIPSGCNLSGQDEISNIIVSANDYVAVAFNSNNEDMIYDDFIKNITSDVIEKCKNELKEELLPFVNELKELYADFDLENSIQFGIINFVK